MQRHDQQKNLSAAGKLHAANTGRVLLQAASIEYSNLGNQSMQKIPSKRMLRRDFQTVDKDKLIIRSQSFLTGFRYGGAYRIRTGDLYNANVARYQLC